MALLDKEIYQAAQQRRLQEQEMRLRNDPGRIFMRSMAQTVPQELLRGGVQMAGDALGYYAFGGEREQMRKDALAFNAARPAFLKKYHRDAYNKGMAANMAAGAPGVGQRPAQRQPQRPAQRPSAPKPTQRDVRRSSDAYVDELKLPEFIDLGDGTFAMEVGEGSARPAMSSYEDMITGGAGQRQQAEYNAFAKEGMVEQGGKVYKVISSNQKKKMEEDLVNRQASRMQFAQEAQEAQALGTGFVAPEDLPVASAPASLPAPAEKEPAYSAAPLLKLQQQTLSTGTGASIKLPKAPGFMASTEEVMAYRKNLNSAREKIADLQSKEGIAREKILKEQTESTVQRIYDFLPEMSEEELVRQRGIFEQMYHVERNPRVRQLLGVAINQIPSEEFRQSAASFMGKAGNRRWKSISKSLPTRINVTTKNRRSILDAVKRRSARMSQIEKLLTNETDPQEREFLESEHAMLKAANFRDSDDKEALESVPVDPRTGKVLDEFSDISGRTPGDPDASKLEKSNLLEFGNDPGNRDAQAAAIKNSVTATKRAKPIYNNPSLTQDEKTLRIQNLFKPLSTTLKPEFVDDKGKGKSKEEPYPNIKRLKLKVDVDDLMGSKNPNFQMTAAEARSLEKIAETASQGDVDKILGYLRATTKLGDPPENRVDKYKAK